MTPQVISIREHEELEIVSSRKRGDVSLSTMHEKMLNRLEKRLPPKSISWTRMGVRFGSHCGVLSLGDTTIEILPKIYGLEEDIGSSRKALVRMLAIARQPKMRNVGLSGVSLQKNSLLDIFVAHFCGLLHEQLLQGMYRLYNEEEDELPTVRGRLLVHKQVRSNLALHGKMVCRFDELNTNNEINRIIKRVLVRLKSMPLGASVRSHVGEQLTWFHEVADVDVSASDVDRIHVDRLAQRYAEVIEWCRWFLRNSYPDVTAGEFECAALLFDMNQLFESFVASRFRLAAARMGMYVELQRPRKYMARSVDTDSDVFMMKPDITIHDESKSIVFIADAKWKTLDDSHKKLGLSQQDLYQVESYASRYGCKRLLLIYPRQSRLSSVKTLRVYGTGSELSIVPLDVLNPVVDKSVLIRPQVATA